MGLGLLVRPVSAQTPVPPTQSYFVFVVSPAVDYVTLIRFGPQGTRIEHRTPVILDSSEVAGPQGISVVPGGRFYYLTTAHGFPNGELLKVAIAGDSNLRVSQPPDTIRGREPLGAVPTAVQVTPDGGYAWVTNSGPDGATTPSSISMVYLEQMVEVARIQTCSMARGSRLTEDGSKHYSVCMTDDRLVEIDVATMKVSRQFDLAGREGATSDPSAPGAPCSPTWAEPSPDGSRIFVACNKSNDVVEVDGEHWKMLRRIPMDDGVDNLALTHNGKLLVGTSRRGQSVAIVDLASGRELARLGTARRFPAGVVISPDDRYAFVSVAGDGTEPGTVEIIDLNTLQRAGTIDVYRTARGIAFWKMGN